MTPPLRVETDELVNAEEGGTGVVADPEPLPSDVSTHRLRRGLLRLGGLLAVAVVVVTLAPGLGELRKRFSEARPGWIAVACAFEVLSVLSYVPAFRAVFCRRMSWATSYKIGVAEEGAGALFPLGGAGSLALGVWALRRGGMPADVIARQTVAFFLLTSAVPVAMLMLLGVGLATGILSGGGGPLLTVLPAAIAGGAIAATLAAVLLYRVIELWIPAVMGIAAFIQLRLLLSRETEAIQLCGPGDSIEIVGVGVASVQRPA